jgi:hypothetical protein
MATQPRNPLVKRMLRAARLDPALYREVAEDETATTEAMLVVVLAAVASGIGSAIGFYSSGLFSGLASGIVSSLVGWAIMTFVTYLVVRMMFGSGVSYQNLLRPLGFARSPGLLTVFGFVLFFGGVLRLLVAIWMLVTWIVAVRESTRITTVESVVTGIVASVGLWVVMWAVGSMFGTGYGLF